LLNSFIRNERIIIVEDDRIRSVVIGPRQRLKPALYIALALTGMFITSVGWVATLFHLHRTNDQLWIAHQALDTLEGSLEERRSALASLSGQLDEIRGTLTQARATVAAAGTVRSDDHAEAAGKAARVAVPRPAGPDVAALAAAVGGTDQALQTMAELVRRATESGEQADGDSTAGSTPVVVGNLDGAARRLGRALVEARAESKARSSEAEELRVANSQLLSRASEAEGRIHAVSEGQVVLLAKLAEHADLRIGEIEGTLKKTGIDLDTVLRQLDETARFGQGGPLVQLPESSAELTPEASQAMQRLESRLAKQARLRALYTLLPLSAPVDDFYVASGYGRRHDPITNQWALHTGLDLVADLKTPVTATAPGTVVKVDYEEGYGPADRGRSRLRHPYPLCPSRQGQCEGRRPCAARPADRTARQFRTHHRAACPL
jgi:murein DD-endopeptidase MepM/ murein hydrolase activator NlpD